MKLQGNCGSPVHVEYRNYDDFINMVYYVRNFTRLFSEWHMTASEFVPAIFVLHCHLWGSITRSAAVDRRDTNERRRPWRNSIKWNDGDSEMTIIKFYRKSEHYAWEKT